MPGNVTSATHGQILPSWTKGGLLLAGAAALLVLLLQAVSIADAAPCGPVPCYTTSDGSSTALAQNKYRWIDDSDVSDHSKPAFVWTEISTTGTMVPGPAPMPPSTTTQDRLGRQTYSTSCIPIGFKFHFYGGSGANDYYDCVWVNSNGMMVLDQFEDVLASPPIPAPVMPADCPVPPYPYTTNTFCTGFPVAPAPPTAPPAVALPSGALPNPMIAGYWVKDADPTVDPVACGVAVTGNAGVFYKTVGPAGARRFIVEFNSVLVRSGDAPNVTCPPPPTPPTCTNAPHVKCYWNTFEMMLLEKSTSAASTAVPDIIEVMLKSVETPEQKPDNGSPIPNLAVLGINAPSGSNGLNYRYGYLCQTPSPNNNAAWNNCYQDRAIRYYPNHLPYAAPLITINEDPATAPTVHLAYDYDCAPDPCMVAGTGDTGSCSVDSPGLAATIGVLTPGVGPAVADPPCQRTFMPATHFCTTHAIGTPVGIPMKVSDQVQTPATTPFSVTATIDVTCINDAPLIDSTPTTAVPAGSADSIATFPGFATGIAAGPSLATDEVTQAMSFPLVSGPPFGTFTAQPTLTRSGGPTSGITAKLSFVGHTPGTYNNICFLAKDNGGTALGGVDTSVNQLCFSITIVPGDGGGDGECGALNGDFSVSAAPLEAGEPITFTDHSTNEGGSIESWEWDFGDGFSSSIPSNTHTYEKAGLYNVRLVVVDAGGCADFKDVVIELHAPGSYTGEPQPLPNGNVAPGGGTNNPIVDAGEDQVVREGTLVRLSAIVKTGAQDSVIFSWRQVSGPTVTLLNSGSASPEFLSPLLGTSTQPVGLLFAVRGNDGLADSIDDYVKVTVIGRDQHTPVADAGNDVTVMKGDSVTLNGGGSVDPDGDAMTYAWTRIGGADVSGLPGQGASVTVTTPTESGYSFVDVKLVVSDGGFAAADTMRIWLQTPSAQSQGFQAIRQTDGSFIFAANTLASEYMWDFGDGGTATTTQPTVTHKYNQTADYVVTLRLGADSAPRSQPVHSELPQAGVPAAPAGISGSALMLGVLAAIFASVVVAALMFFALRNRNKRVP